MLGRMLVPVSCKSESFHLLGFESSVLVFRNRASLLFMSAYFLVFFNFLSFLAVSLLLKFD
jgi:hypothetical protein